MQDYIDIHEFPEKPEIAGIISLYTGSVREVISPTSRESIERRC